MWVCVCIWSLACRGAVARNPHHVFKGQTFRRARTHKHTLTLAHLHVTRAQPTTHTEAKQIRLQSECGCVVCMIAKSQTMDDVVTRVLWHANNKYAKNCSQKTINLYLQATNSRIERRRALVQKRVPRSTPNEAQGPCPAKVHCRSLSHFHLPLQYLTPETVHCSIHFLCHCFQPLNPLI